jgi:protein TonB
MIAYLSPHESFQPHPIQHSQTRARAAGILLAAAGHGALLLWLLGQNFRQPNIVDNTPDQPPVVVQTIDLTPPKPSPVSTPTAPINNVHASPTPLTRSVKTLPVKVADVKMTGPVSVNPFINRGVGETLTLGTPTIAHTLTNPDWISRPTAHQVEQAYPEADLREGITGSATLSCQVTSAGGVVGCKINVETPPGRGFGRAALALTHYFRIRPGTDNGLPIEGASVLIPIRFTISG